jgi:hypothetical protein
VHRLLNKAQTTRITPPGVARPKLEQNFDFDIPLSHHGETLHLMLWNQEASCGIPFVAARSHRHAAFGLLQFDV